jgi:hypothetical protein
MNTKQLHAYHLEIAAQSNKCADILRLINRVNGEIESTVEWLKMPNLDWMLSESYIESKRQRMEEQKTKTINRLMSYYQNELIKLDQIYKQ